MHAWVCRLRKVERGSHLQALRPSTTQLFNYYYASTKASKPTLPEASRLNPLHCLTWSSPTTQPSLTLHFAFTLICGWGRATYFSLILAKKHSWMCNFCFYTNQIYVLNICNNLLIPIINEILISFFFEEKGIWKSAIFPSSTVLPSFLFPSDERQF